jgi:hypothetical protein
LRLQEAVQIRVTRTVEIAGMQRQQMRGVHKTGQAGIRVNVDCDHQIQAEDGKIRKVVLRQLLATKVRMHATQTAKATSGNTYALKIRQLNTPIVANHHVLNMAFAINQNSELSSCFVGELRQLAGKFGANNLVWRNTTRIEFLYTPYLVRLESQGIP